MLLDKKTNCSSCGITKTPKWYFHSNQYKSTLCKKCYDRIRNSNKSTWFLNRRKKYRMNGKLRVLRKCGSTVCINCGQTDIRVLELNMIGGGHTKLVRDKKMAHGGKLHEDIVAGRVDHKLFNVLCKPCNMAEYVERVFGIKYKITSSKD